ncbi:hypothetical protein [Serratia sp. Se-RSBMAAmG]|uniref:hypothetical protein n=1 Tax=Serratia sp. Se-RSBMAAmG TaxID=3043305 RepID=UPI0024AFF821|nr:hypothetical protein [Serratia sp. Se-RSBMAAmG]MDI6977117.1 hypothetical protein [Serratia sp. Se-RSBMAAmG]
MNNFVKLTFVANSKVDNDTLHSLYTTLRFKEKKIENLQEDFKVWNEGRNIFIIMEKDKIENESMSFEFISKNKEYIKIKKFSGQDLSVDGFQVGDFVKVSGFISYAQKIKQDNGKTIEICPLDFKGNIKNKDKFIHYLNNSTGLDFSENIDSNDRVIINRLFVSDIGINNKDNESKVFMKNIIMINAIVKVIDVDLANSLFFRSIGKKRSYGMGNLFVEKI